jgi:alkylation response protein AidB-like acyl-CoA dehydrogenase
LKEASDFPCSYVFISIATLGLVLSILLLATPFARFYRNKRFMPIWEGVKVKEGAIVTTAKLG